MVSKELHKAGGARCTWKGGPRHGPWGRDSGEVGIGSAS
jgi:hypothetical protein